jgi:hypothetical protein
MVTITNAQGTWDEVFAYCSKKETRVSEDYHASPSLLRYNGEDVSFLEDVDVRFPWQETLFKKLFISENKRCYNSTYFTREFIFFKCVHNFNANLIYRLTKFQTLKKGPFLLFFNLIFNLVKNTFKSSP